MAKASATITLFYVVDIAETHRYYLLQSATASAPAKPTAYPPGGSWVTTEPSYTEGSTNKLYFVDCTVYTDGTFEYTPVSLSSSYEAAKAAYNKAVNAQNTANDVKSKTIYDVDVMYALGTSTTTAPTSGWSTTAPAWESGKYMWQKTVVTYGDETTEESAATCITGATGQTGGVGSDGKGISSIIEEYYQSTSATALEGGSWSTTYPGWVDGTYIWTRSVISYTSGDPTTTTAVCVTGSKGATGATGARGTGTYKITTAPTAYTTTTGGFTPSFRILKSTANNQAGATVKKGDTLRYSYYLYPVGFVDSNYVYLGARTSIRGATGAAGADGVDGAPGMTNILRGTNSVEALTSTSPWSKGWWRAGGTGTGERTIIDITDAPNPNIKLGFQIVGNNDDSNVAQNDIPVTVGETYTISAYARGTGTFRLQIGDETYSYKNFNLEDETTWVRCSYTKIAGTNFSASDGNTNVYFANRGEGTIQICGLKLEHGEAVTEWTPSPLDFEDREPKYGVCDTPKGTAAKVTTITKGSPNIKAGDTVSICFEEANTALNPTLNVDDMGAKPILTNGVPYAYWVAGQTVMFTYDGTNWQVASTPVYADTVTVGNSAGLNTYIDGEGFYVRNGDTTLSTFKAEEIKLGQNSNTAVIDLCNGMAQFKSADESTAEDFNRLLINAEHSIGLETAGEVTMDTYYESVDGIMSSGIFRLTSSMPWVEDGNVYSTFRIYTDLNDGGGYVCYSSVEGNQYGVSLEAKTETLDTEYKASVDLWSQGGGDGELRSVIDLYADEIDLNGLVTCSDDIYLYNGKAIRGYDADGTVRTLIHINSANNTLLGYGGYAGQIGYTDIYGWNGIRLATNGYVHILTGGGLVLANNKFIFIQNKAGTSMNMVWANASDQYGYGYGSYSGITGSVFYDGNYWYGRSKNTMSLEAGQGLALYSNCAATYRSNALEVWREQSGSTRTIFRCLTNGGAYLGTTSYRWNTAFFTNAITASDLKYKDVIDDFDFKIEDFIMGLKPIAYRRNDQGDTGKRIHMGLGAQDVDKLIRELGIGNMSIVQASVITEEEVTETRETGEVDENDNPITEEVLVTRPAEESYHGEDIDDEKLSWGLNYNEFIAPMILMLQKQQKEIKELRQCVEELKGDK